METYTRILRRWYMGHMQEMNQTWTPFERAMSNAVFCGAILDELRRVA